MKLRIQDIVNRTPPRAGFLIVGLSIVVSVSQSIFDSDACEGFSRAAGDPLAGRDGN